MEQQAEDAELKARKQAAELKLTTLQQQHLHPQPTTIAPAVGGALCARERNAKYSARPGACWAGMPALGKSPWRRKAHVQEACMQSCCLNLSRFLSSLARSLAEFRLVLAAGRQTKPTRWLFGGSLDGGVACGMRSRARAAAPALPRSCSRSPSLPLPLYLALALFLSPSLVLARAFSRMLSLSLSLSLSSPSLALG